MCLFNPANLTLARVSPALVCFSNCIDRSLPTLTHSLNKFTQEGKSFSSFEGLLLLETLSQGEWMWLLRLFHCWMTERSSEFHSAISSNVSNSDCFHTMLMCQQFSAEDQCEQKQHLTLKAFWYKDFAKK